jgi:hypothetical protein
MNIVMCIPSFLFENGAGKTNVLNSVFSVFSFFALCLEKEI